MGVVDEVVGKFWSLLSSCGSGLAILRLSKEKKLIEGSRALG
jgi:hypothetical protein